MEKRDEQINCNLNLSKKSVWDMSQHSESQTTDKGL